FRIQEALGEKKNYRKNKDQYQYYCTWEKEYKSIFSRFFRYFHIYRSPRIRKIGPAALLHKPL
ncbi:hypothetical protein KA005_34665, partial [bacterium]|nr:hypothetical protein [bacterium]